MTVYNFFLLSIMYIEDSVRTGENNGEKSKQNKV